jgi:ferritin
MDQQLITAINKQIQTEISASYHYLALENFFAEQALNGFAAFFSRQANEELQHAMKFKKYLQDTNSKVELFEIPKPKQDFQHPLSAVESALQAEINNTNSIHAIFTLARELKCIRTENFLQWFVEEQLEEEASMREIIDRLNLAGDSKSALLLLDKEMIKKD